METMFMNTKNSKTNKSHKFDKHIDKHIALSNLTIYQTWKNIRKWYKDNILKTIATT